MSDSNQWKPPETLERLLRFDWKPPAVEQGELIVRIGHVHQFFHFGLVGIPKHTQSLKGWRSPPVCLEIGPDSACSCHLCKMQLICPVQRVQ